MTIPVSELGVRRDCTLRRVRLNRLDGRDDNAVHLSALAEYDGSSFWWKKELAASQPQRVPLDAGLLQQLGEQRLKDAELLLNHGHWAAAYYLTGYAIECALKSCLLRHLQTSVGLAKVFSDKDFFRDCWTHKLEQLVSLAGLEDLLEQECTADPVFAGNWAVTKEWTEETRYRLTDEVAARELVDSVTDPDHGVMRWLRQHW